MKFYLIFIIIFLVVVTIVLIIPGEKPNVYIYKDLPKAPEIYLKINTITAPRLEDVMLFLRSATPVVQTWVSHREPN